MEPRKLTRADIDKVRHIEGFPVAADEDIIERSRAPFYTACPNPFISDFLAEYGTPYEEGTDDYHCKAVQKIVQKFVDQGDIYKGKYEDWYCMPCENYFTTILPTFLASIMMETIPSFSREFLVSNRKERPIFPSASFQYLK